MKKTTLAAAALTASLLAAPARAQDRSVFAVLDVEDRVVAPGDQVARGTLATEDLIATGGRRIQVWRLDASVGDELQIDMRSGDFDPYLYLVGPGLGEGLTDDDGGDGLNARLCLAVDEPGDYRVVTSSLSSATGGYTLQVVEREGVSDGACPEDDAEASSAVDDPSTLPTDDRVLRVGVEAEGELTSADAVLFGSPAQAWALDGIAGQSVTVDLLSDEFDAYLTVAGPGLESPATDDDGAGRCDSRVTIEFPESGLYRVVASTLGASAGGRFRLVVTREPGAVSDESCTPPDDEPEVDIEAIAVVGSLSWEQTHDGALTGSETEYDGKRVQAWTLQAAAGDRVMIDMRSSDFDSYLYLTGPGFDEPARNDDGGDNLNARLCAELAEGGTFRVLAGPYSGGDAGQLYTIRASRADVEAQCEEGFELSEEAIEERLAALPTEGRTLALGQEAAGTLEATDARHPDTDDLIQAWSFRGEAGRTVYVDVLSDEFDPVLYALGTGIDGVLYIDDAGGGCNSRLPITPSESGTILLFPGAYTDEGMGAFVIRASEDPPPLGEGVCPADVTSDDPAEPQIADATALDGISSGDDRPIQLETVVTGTLGADDQHRASGEPAQAWTLAVRGGEELTIELRSEAFDPMLFVDGASLGAPLVDDDSAGDLDSRIVYTPSEDGTLRLVVTAYDSAAAGEFELSIVRRLP